MTSSHKATSQPSVRQAAQAGGAEASVWSLAELPTEHDFAFAMGPSAGDGLDPAAIADEIARRTDEAYQRGLADGQLRAAAAATQAAEARMEDALRVVTNAVTQIEELASLAPGVLEENVAALAVMVARQIVTREVTADRELVADLVRRALTEFPIDQSVRIRVHPLDLAALALSGGGGQASPITGTRDASWLADPRVSRGGCLIEGRDRIVDGRVDTALERAYQRMAGIDAS